MREMVSFPKWLIVIALLFKCKCLRLFWSVAIHLFLHLHLFITLNVNRAYRTGQHENTDKANNGMNDVMDSFSKLKTFSHSVPACGIQYIGMSANM